MKILGFAYLNNTPPLPQTNKSHSQVKQKKNPKHENQHALSKIGIKV